MVPGQALVVGTWAHGESYFRRDQQLMAELGQRFSEYFFGPALGIEIGSIH